MSGKSPVVRGGACPLPHAHRALGADGPGDATGARASVALDLGALDRIALLLEVTRQERHRDDGDHEAGVHAVVELLDQGRQDDATQDRAVHVRGSPDAREHAQEEGEEQRQADQAVGEDDRPELALRSQGGQPRRGRGTRGAEAQERGLLELIERLKVVGGTVFRRGGGRDAFKERLRGRGGQPRDHTHNDGRDNTQDGTPGSRAQALETHPHDDDDEADVHTAVERRGCRDNRQRAHGDHDETPLGALAPQL